MPWRASGHGWTWVGARGCNMWVGGLAVGQLKQPGHTDWANNHTQAEGSSARPPSAGVGGPCTTQATSGQLSGGSGGPHVRRRSPGSGQWRRCWLGRPRPAEPPPTRLLRPPAAAGPRGEAQAGAARPGGARVRCRAALLQSSERLHSRARQRRRRRTACRTAVPPWLGQEAGRRRPRAGAPPAASVAAARRSVAARLPPLAAGG